MTKSKSYDEYLLNLLINPQEARDYLASALEDGDPKVIAIALDYVVKARKINKSQLARKTNINREHLYKILSESSNPEFKTLQSILKAIGYQLTITECDRNSNNASH